MRIPWTFYDPVAVETYEHPINPDKMTAPHDRKNLSHARGTKTGQTRAASWDGPKTPLEWQFEGNIRTQAQHDALDAWARKGNPIEVSDHLGRTFEVALRKFEPIDRRPTAITPWRMRYKMTAYILRELS